VFTKGRRCRKCDMGWSTRLGVVVVVLNGCFAAFRIRSRGFLDSCFRNSRPDVLQSDGILKGVLGLGFRRGPRP
jgi:hypothetical protein